MRKTLLLCVVCFISILATAQLLEIVSTQQLTIPANEELKVAAISPKGDYLLLTNDVNRGLMQYNLSTGNITTITDAEGAGWGVKISPNGQEVVYRERYMNADQTLRNNIMQYTIKAQKKSVIAKGQRDLSKLASVNLNSNVTINSDLHMVLTQGNKTTVLTPNGVDEAYNWASLSPDGTKILYYVSGKGCYTCDLHGRDIHYIALDCRAPQWYNNHIIVGMHDEDNGKWMTASAIVAYNMQGDKQILVNKENMAVYPYTANGKIAFSTIYGEIYLMNVK